MTTATIAASTEINLPARARLASGSRGYEGHCLTRQEMAQYTAASSGMGYRAAYRAVKAQTVIVGNMTFSRQSIHGRRGWWAYSK